MGLLLDDLFSALFNSVTAVACALVVTGICSSFPIALMGKRRCRKCAFRKLCLSAFSKAARSPRGFRVRFNDFRCFALWHAAAGAARFSFIVSIPVILGAAQRNVGIWPLPAVLPGMDLFSGCLCRSGERLCGDPYFPAAAGKKEYALFFLLCLGCRFTGFWQPIAGLIQLPF